jgi:hypothetical protein
MSDHATNLKLALKAEKALDKIDQKEADAHVKAAEKAEAARFKVIDSLVPGVASLMSDRTPEA